MENNNSSGANRKIATRQIEMTTLEGPEGMLVLEGVLRDDRHIEFNGFSGDTIPAGRFHTIKARLFVSVEEMRIEDIKVGFEDVPYRECRDMGAKYRSLIGLSIESGLTRAVLERVGGEKACSHLTHLIITMGPAFVQAAFTYRTRVESSSYPTNDQVRRYFLDSCYIWRADGPRGEKYRQK